MTMETQAEPKTIEQRFEELGRMHADSNEAHSTGGWREKGIGYLGKRMLADAGWFSRLVHDARIMKTQDELEKILVEIGLASDRQEAQEVIPQLANGKCMGYDNNNKDITIKRLETARGQPVYSVRCYSGNWD